MISRKLLYCLTFSCNHINYKVDVALECARLQHRLSLPPLEVEDFPQAASGNIHDMKVLQHSTSHHQMVGQSAAETDILQEILSVAHVSQELINNPNSYVDPTMWGGGSVLGAGGDDFTFVVGREAGQSSQANEMMRYMDNSCEDPISKSIYIGDFDEDFKMERMAENLRWVGMSSKDADEVLFF